MTAAMLVLEPIFEADLQPEQYAYRPERSALDAVTHVSALLHSRHREVIDADLSGYFDSYPACRVNEIGGSSHQRSAHVTADQDVASSTGGRDRQAGSQTSNDPEQRHGTRNAPGRSDLTDC